MINSNLPSQITKEVIYLVEDDLETSNSIRWLLESHGYQVLFHDRAESLLEELTKTDENRVCCGFFDVRLPNLSGIELHAYLLKNNIKFPVCFITGYGEVQQAVQALKQGAFDFIQKPFRADQICKIAEKMLEKANIEAQSNVREKEAKNKINLLTAREKQVLERVLAGMANIQISAELSIAVKTVEVHRSHIMNKLGVSNAITLLKLSMNQKHL